MVGNLGSAANPSNKARFRMKEPLEGVIFNQNLKPATIDFVGPKAAAESIVAVAAGTPPAYWRTKALGWLTLWFSRLLFATNKGTSSSSQTTPHCYLVNPDVP